MRFIDTSIAQRAKALYTPSNDTRKLTPSERLAVFAYTVPDFYNKLNTELRSTKKLDNELEAFYQTLKSGILKLEPYIGKCYRWAELEEVDLFKEGSIVKYDQFLSASIAERPDSLVLSHRPALIALESLTAAYIAPYSRYPDEEEVIFLPGVEFVVIFKYEFENIFYLGLDEIQS